jgi:hypothetical protein
VLQGWLGRAGSVDRKAQKSLGNLATYRDQNYSCECFVKSFSLTRSKWMRMEMEQMLPLARAACELKSPFGSRRAEVEVTW